MLSAGPPVVDDHGESRAPSVNTFSRPAASICQLSLCASGTRAPKKQTLASPTHSRSVSGSDQNQTALGMSTARLSWSIGFLMCA